MKSWGFVFLGVVFVLTGCGTDRSMQNSGVPTFEVPVLDADRERFLKNFPLLDDQSEEKPPRDPVTGKSPFGALIHMASFGRGKFCSLSHVSLGYAVTNAHCVGEFSHTPYNFFIVYYNKHGEKHFTRVDSFEYKGSTDSDDIAILRFPREAALEWDTIEGRAVETEAEINQTPRATHEVVVWTFNPLEGNHPDLAEKYQGPGMRFAPKHCLASRTVPSLVGWQEEGDRKIRIRTEKGNAALHWFLDECDFRLVHGNSGSLITEAKNISRALGTFHWTVPFDKQGLGIFRYFEYTGNSNRTGILSPDEMEKRDFYGVGTDFFRVLRLQPGWL